MCYGYEVQLGTLSIHCSIFMIIAFKLVLHQRILYIKKSLIWLIHSNTAKTSYRTSQPSVYEMPFTIIIILWFIIRAIYCVPLYWICCEFSTKRLNVGNLLLISLLVRFSSIEKKTMKMFRGMKRRRKRRSFAKIVLSADYFAWDKIWFCGKVAF